MWSPVPAAVLLSVRSPCVFRVMTRPLLPTMFVVLSSAVGVIISSVCTRRAPTVSLPELSCAPASSFTLLAFTSTCTGVPLTTSKVALLFKTRLPLCEATTTFVSIPSPLTKLSRPFTNICALFFSVTSWSTLMLSFAFFPSSVTLFPDSTVNPPLVILVAALATPGFVDNSVPTTNLVPSPVIETLSFTTTPSLPATMRDFVTAPP